MKQLIILIAILCPLISVAQVNSTFIIEGKTNKPATYTLQYFEDGKPVKNIAQVKDGMIKISGTTNKKGQASLMVIPDEVEGTPKPMAFMVRLWLEPGDIKANNLDSIGKIFFSGTPLNDDQNELVKLKQTIKGDPTSMAYNDKQKAVSIQFIKAHPNSLVSLTELNYSLSRGIPDLNVVEPLFNSLSAEIKISPEGKNYLEKLGKWKKVDVGSIAPDFAQPDQNGKIVKLSDFKGKYVFIDFWASWCHPCRDENPNVLAQYNLYKDKNLVILSVSLDEIKDNWIKAIKEDKLPWKQLSDLKRQNEAKVRYSVGSIPENFLVDPDGKIIAKSLRGEELNKKLKEVFNK
ncbi:peroxiredoxin family protein [Pedobacter mendelii]|uniref:Thiol:disulfide interchange protein n=1 Tax=Pedobacter mendelii TaxID=1908240 RepID=A0ABQ2BIM0_9SPHI|nr:TlpA disulfide reductase family protein [Pedobacter mendelii]GGI25290.1 thiol:disulfide interchange protein [Pedobacter mendelii]